MSWDRIRGMLGAALALMCVACLGGGPVRTAPTALSDVMAEYQLGPGDRLRISVFGEAELSGEFVVTPAGSVAYPLVGNVEAQGKTVSEFTDSLTETLRAGYVRQPMITVEVTNYRPFYILGEVNAPGTYPFTSGLTVMNAVATAGGFTYRASPRRVFIKHANAENEQEYPLTSQTLVRPGDTIRIPERRF